MNLREKVVRVWAGFSWFRIWSSGKFLWMSCGLQI